MEFSFYLFREREVSSCARHCNRGAERVLTHRNIAIEFDMPRDQSTLSQSRFERIRATDKECDGIVPPFSLDVLLGLEKFPTFVDSIERTVGANVGVESEM